MSKQHIRNWMRSRYGGASTEDKINALVNKFTEDDDKNNSVRILKDDDGVMCGIVMISGVQKEIYAKYGDCLLMDWTHSTNNRGFLLGELLCTGPHGKGISVAHMLVMNQLETTMTACLEFVKEKMEVDITESFVVDKDFTEWKVLKKLWPRANVMLYQWHALEAVKRAAALPKYDIASTSTDNKPTVAFPASCSTDGESFEKVDTGGDCRETQ